MEEETMSGLGVDEESADIVRGLCEVLDNDGLPREGRRVSRGDDLLATDSRRVEASDS